MSRTTRARKARDQAEDRLAALRARQLGIAQALADSQQQEETMTELTTDPQPVTVNTIMQMCRAFPGMDCAMASRLFTEADQAEREGDDAADTLGLFAAEDGTLWRVTRVKHRVYRVTTQPIADPPADPPKRTLFMPVQRREHDDTCRRGQDPTAPDYGLDRERCERCGNLLAALAEVQGRREALLAEVLTGIE